MNVKSPYIWYAHYPSAVDVKISTSNSSNSERTHGSSSHCESKILERRLNLDVEVGTEMRVRSLDRTWWKVSARLEELRFIDTIADWILPQFSDWVRSSSPGMFSVGKVRRRISKPVRRLATNEKDVEESFYVTARSMYLLNLSQFHPSFPNFSQAVFVSFYLNTKTSVVYPPTIYILPRGFIIARKVDRRTPSNHTPSFGKSLVLRCDVKWEHDWPWPWKHVTVGIFLRSLWFMLSRETLERIIWSTVIEHQS